MAIQVGNIIPNAEVFLLGNHGPESIYTEALFKNKNIVLFALTGAFTKTCSTEHLPGYIDLASDFFCRGIDEIFCLAVNDAWVMNAWGVEKGVEGKITMLSDGNGVFSEAMDQLINISEKGFGYRSNRYALIAKNCVISHLNIEEPSEFKISDAQTLLAQL